MKKVPRGVLDAQIAEHWRPIGFWKHELEPGIPKVGRNDPCPCGSGRKYKKCHGRPGPRPLYAIIGGSDGGSDQDVRVEETEV